MTGIGLGDLQQHIIPDFNLALVIDAIHDGTVILDDQGVIVAVNKAWRQFCAENDGNTDTFYVGSNYMGICESATGENSAGAVVIAEKFRDVIRTGMGFRHEYPCDSPTEKRWFELTANRLRHDGSPFLLVQHRDISTRHSQREDIIEAFKNSSALAAIIASTSDAILSYDLNGNIQTWNRAAEKLYGYKAEEALGKSLEMLYPPDWRKRVTYYRDEIIAGRLTHFEATRIAKDGTRKEVWISGAPIRGADGEVVGVSNIHRDVSERRKAESARDLIAQEVIHRAKNMLSIVSAIQRQTARSEKTLEGFNAKFGERLQSLVRSTDLLVEGNWTTVGLRELIARHLAPFAEVDDDRVVIEGTALDLLPQGVQTIGMALHELATNSAKYGALSRPDGHLLLSWNVEGSEDEPEKNLKFQWLEQTKADLSDVGTSGFGSRVLTMLAPSMLDTRSDYVMGDQQIRWSISISDKFFSSTAPRVIH